MICKLATQKIRLAFEMSFYWIHVDLFHFVLYPFLMSLTWFDDLIWDFPIFATAPKNTIRFKSDQNWPKRYGNAKNNFVDTKSVK